MTGIDHELATLAQQGDLASFCPRCHAALNVYDAETRRVWVGLDVEVGDVACDLLVNPRLEEFERVCSPCWTGDAVATDVLCPHCHASLLEDEGLCGECEARVFTIDVSLHTRVAPLSCCTRAGLPLARRAQEDARQDPRRGAAAEEAGAGPAAPRAQLPGGQLRLRQRAGGGRGEPLPAVQEADLRRRLPRGRRHPRVRRPGGRGRLRRRGPAASARRTRCRPSAGASARRTTSARRSACWATRASRSPSARSSGSPPTSSARPTRSRCRREPRRRAAASPWSAAARRG